MEDFTRALGCGVSQTTAYNNVPAAGAVAQQRQSHTVRQGGKRAVIGADATYVRLREETVGIAVVVDDTSGELLGLEIISREKSTEIRDIIPTIAEQVDAEVLREESRGKTPMM